MEPTPTSSDKGAMNQPEYPETDLIDPQRAKLLYEEHCAILIVEDLPVGSEFGIDMVVYRTGEKFKGVKLIPPGVHLVYIAAVWDKDIQHCGPRCGFFHDFKSKELLVKRWSAKDEDFDDSFAPDDEYLMRYSQNLRDLDRYLGAYKFSTYQTYLALINHLSSCDIKCLLPSCNRIRSVPYLVGKNSGDERRSHSGRLIRRATIAGHEKPSEENLLTDLQPEETTVINFTRIPENHVDSGQIYDNAEMITEYNIDSTMKLDETFPNDSGRHKLLAEMQFAFVTLLFYQVYDCFEQWKKILDLVCGADKAVEKYPAFYLDFIRTLSKQLQQVPEDLFVDIANSKNLVRGFIDRLFQNINSIIGNEDLKLESDRMRQLAENRFGWQFDLEPDDEQPVVVDY